MNELFNDKPPSFDMFTILDVPTDNMERQNYDLTNDSLATRMMLIFICQCPGGALIQAGFPQDDESCQREP